MFSENQNVSTSSVEVAKCHEKAMIADAHLAASLRVRGHGAPDAPALPVPRGKRC